MLSYTRTDNSKDHVGQMISQFVVTLLQKKKNNQLMYHALYVQSSAK